MSEAERRTGTVIDFDEHVGLGRIEHAGDQLLFHCVEIADGTRTISVGTSVSFVIVTRFGVREASAIEKLA